MNHLLAIAVFLSSNLLIVQSKEIYGVDYVFFEMAPYIYYKNGTLKGAFVDMFDKVHAMCNLKFTLKHDVQTIQNMTDILQNPTEHSYMFNNNTSWLSLSFTISEQLAKNNGLQIREGYSAQGIEVVMHRHQIALLVKIWSALNDCRHLISLVLILTACFGILIWIAVSEYQIFFNHNPYCCQIIYSNEK